MQYVEIDSTGICPIHGVQNPHERKSPKPENLALCPGLLLSRDQDH